MLHLVPHEVLGNEVLLGSSLENALHHQVAVLVLCRLERVGLEVLRLRILPVPPELVRLLIEAGE